MLGARATRWFLVVAALIGGGALIAGCGGSSATKSASLVRAADKSTSAAGYRMTMSINESVAGKSIDISATGGFDVHPHQGSMLMNMSIAGQTLPIQLVLAHDTIYEELPSQVSSRLPGGKPWISVNIGQLSTVTKIPGLSSLVGSDSSFTNPGQYLDFLKAASSGSVQNLGQETIGGVQTTHYSAQIDLSKLARAVPASVRTAVSQMVTALKQRLHASYSPINVWIDQSDLIRKVQINVDETVDGRSASSTITEQITAYGTQPAPTVPPASQTTDLLSLIRGG